MNAESRVGWCPGVHRPGAARDGLVVRVKPRGATLSIDQAVGIAAAAASYGNGALDLTNRANLQVRGVAEASLQSLTLTLGRLGLLDPDAGAEARRNVLSSPLAGLDPTALLDIRPVVAALEERLVADTSLAGLPGKFGFAVSDGGSRPLDGVSADLCFDAVRTGAGEVGFAIRLGDAASPVAFCRAAAVPDAAARLAGLFIAARAADPDLLRMRGWVARVGADTILRQAGLQVGDVSETPLHLASPETGSSQPSTGGASGGGAGAPPFVFGVAAPFGRLGARQLDALARGAACAGAHELRLTPWRRVLVPGIDPAEAGRLAADCAALGLVTDRDDPRLRVAACAGEPGCHRGTTAVLDDATLWAALLGPGRRGDGIALHVSGCAKGCAHPGPSPLTLVAENGRYAIVRNGTASGMPSAVDLAPEAVSAWLMSPEGRLA